MNKQEFLDFLKQESLTKSHKELEDLVFDYKNRNNIDYEYDFDEEITKIICKRTHVHIMADLLEAVVETEWKGKLWKGCHCHPELVSVCPSCEAEEYPKGYSYQKRDYQIHEDDCSLQKLIKETREFLQIEMDKKEENVYYLNWSIS